MPAAQSSPAASVACTGLCLTRVKPRARKTSSSRSTARCATTCGSGSSSSFWSAVLLTDVVRAVVLFGLAGLAEIGGGWLVWQWLRESRPWPFGLVGALVLVGYGVIPTLQGSPHFGRVYAAYGG